MRKSFLPLAIILLLVTFFGFLLENRTSAQEDAAVGVQITPASFDLVINPLEIVEKKITIANPTKETQNINIRFLDIDIERTNEEGTMQVIEPGKERGDNPFLLARWVKLSKTNLILQHLQDEEITLEINIPYKAEPGGHYAVLEVTPQLDTQEFADDKDAENIERDASKISRSNLATAAQASATVFVTVPGEINWAAEVPSFSTRRFFEKGPVVFNTIFNNTGNIHQKPKGKIEIYSRLGNKKVDEVEVRKKTVLPGGKQILKSTWDKSFLIGKYTAILNLEFGEDYSQKERRIVTFWAFPYKMAGAALAAITIVLLASTRKSKKETKKRRKH